MAASRTPAQTQTARAIEEQQGSGVGHALPAASPVDGTCLNSQLAGTAPLLSSPSGAAVVDASSTAAGSRLEVAEANGCSTADLDAQTVLPRGESSNLPNAHQNDISLATPSRRPLSFASPAAEADADVPSSSTAGLDDGMRVEEEGQAEERHLESPGRFAAAQLLLIQQRQQQLQKRRLAALREAGKTGLMSAAPLLQQSEHRQTSLLASLKPALPQECDTLFEPTAKQAHCGAVGAETVASSPVVLFSPGGPYCDKSKWYLSAEKVQVGQHDDKQHSTYYCYHQILCKLESRAYRRNQPPLGYSDSVANCWEHKYSHHSLHLSSISWSS